MQVIAALLGVAGIMAKQMVYAYLERRHKR
jgi:hypothetical protein